MVELDVVGRAILAKHFPDFKYDDVRMLAIFLSPPWVTMPTHPAHSFIKDSEDVEKSISTFQRAIAEAWHSYFSLPIRIRMSAGINATEFLKLASACGATPAYGTDVIQSPVIDALKSAAKGAVRLSAQAMAAEHPEKIALVDTARLAWIELTNEEPPLKPSEGSAYLEFVGDVISGAGKTWGVDKTLAAWRTATERLEG